MTLPRAIKLFSAGYFFKNFFLPKPARPIKHVANKSMVVGFGTGVPGPV